MNVHTSFALGIRKVNRTKRMIVFAWLLNVLLALVVAAPMLGLLNEAIAPTVMEERLLEQLDLNWIETFRADRPNNPIAQMLLPSRLGAPPFYEHLDQVINGATVTSIGRFLGSLFFEFRVNTNELDLAAVIMMLYVLLWTYLSGAFVGIYAREHRSSFTEFLQLGARYFGKFFRLVLIQVVVYVLLFLLVEWVSRNIRVWTANEPSELTAFVYFMIRNAGVIVMIGLITLLFDYAKIRMVVDTRVSAVAAFGAGIRFVVTHPVRTVLLALILAVLGAVLAATFVLLEQQIVQSTFWTIFLVFILQQLYVWSRQWLRAAYYATQTALYQASTRVRETESAAANGVVGVTGV